MLDYLKVWPQYLLPQHLLSRGVYHLTRWKNRFWKDILITQFIKLFNVEMSDAAADSIKEYASFNEFFTRELKPDARPFEHDAHTIISPVDGFLSQHGKITDGELIQAKGKHFTLNSLLADDRKLSERFANGTYATLYLSPKNYHRIHMPLAGQLEKMIYVPGKLFAVNSHTTRVVDSLFSRNERAIVIFSTDVGKVAMIMVGAIFVGSMQTVWAGEINSPYPDDIKTDLYDAMSEPIQLAKGEEMGRFNMGSTVILLFEQDVMSWDQELVQGQEIRMGQKLGEG